MYRALFLLGHDASRRGAGSQVTSSTANAVPLPLKGKDLTPPKLRRASHCSALWLMLSGLWSLVSHLTKRSVREA